MTAIPRQMMDEFCAYLADNDISFQRQDHAPAMVTFDFALDEALGRVTVQTFFSENGYSLSASMDRSATRKTRQAVLEYANMINFWEKTGNFEMYYELGVVFFRLEVMHAGEAPLPLEVVERSVRLTKQMYKKYAAGFAALMAGTAKDPEKVFRQAAAPSEGTPPTQDRRPQLIVLQGGKKTRGDMGKSPAP